MENLLDGLMETTCINFFENLEESQPTLMVILETCQLFDPTMEKFMLIPVVN